MPAVVAESVRSGGACPAPLIRLPVGGDMVEPPLAMFSGRNMRVRYMKGHGCRFSPATPVFTKTKCRRMTRMLSAAGSAKGKRLPSNVHEQTAHPKHVRPPLKHKTLCQAQKEGMFVKRYRRTLASVKLAVCVCQPACFLLPSFPTGEQATETEVSKPAVTQR